MVGPRLAGIALTGDCRRWHGRCVNITIEASTAMVSVSMDSAKEECMARDSDDVVDRDLKTGEPLDFDPLDGAGDLEERIRVGEITRDAADELLQAAAHRETAEHGPDLDTDADGTTTEGGFGTGQGMASQSKRHGNVG